MTTRQYIRATLILGAALAVNVLVFWAFSLWLARPIVIG